MDTLRRVIREGLSDWRGYLAAVGLPALATLLKYLGKPSAIPADVPTLYILATIVTAFLFGLAPAMVCCVVSLLAFDYFFVPPLRNFGPANLQSTETELIFLIVGITVSYLQSTLRWRTEEATKEASARRKAEELLKATNATLEQSVAERTKALRESEDQLRRISGAAKVGLYQWNMSRDTAYWSPETYQLFGIEPGLAANSETWLARVHTDDKERVVQNMASIVEEAQGGAGHVSRLNEYRVVHSDGVVLWLEATTAADYEGGEVILRGAVRDITERKKMEQQLKESRDGLELRVRERTAEIETMAERLRALSHRLIGIQEAERGNIARELHDQIGQSLFAIKNLLERADTAADKDRRDLRDEAVPLLAELIDRVSMLSLDLRPKILDDLGLKEALEWYFGRFTSQTRIRVQFEPHDVEKSRGTWIDNTIYRVAQEALTNVARHAHATMVTVELTAHNRGIRMRIEDDGMGFEPASLSASNSGGITGMQERINQVGGSLLVQSKPGSGTRLIAEIPYQSESARRESQA